MVGGWCVWNGFGVIRGAMRKKVYINLNDVIIVSVRDFEPDKVDVIHKYTNDEVRELIKLKEIPSNIHDDNTGTDGKIEAQIDFAESDSDDDGVFKGDLTDEVNNSLKTCDSKSLNLYGLKVLAFFII